MGLTAGFSGKLTLKLSDFQVPFTREFEPGRRVVADELKVELQVEAKPQALVHFGSEWLTRRRSMASSKAPSIPTSTARRMCCRASSTTSSWPQRFKARHMAGFVLKSHYICTADRATLVNQIVPEVQAFGAIALNNSVGGLNPLALDIAGRLGTASCFLPSVDNANELEAIAGPARREQAAVLDEHRPRDARAGHRRLVPERDRGRQGHPGHAPVPGDHRQARHGAGDQPHPAVGSAAGGQGRSGGRASSASSSPIPSSRRRC